MKLGMINSCLVVCFTMVQKIYKSENIYKILTYTSRNGYKTIFSKKDALLLQAIQEKILPNIFPQFRLTKHL